MTEEEFRAKIIEADRKGDKDGARVLAAEYKRRKAAGAFETQAQEAPEPTRASRDQSRAAAQGRGTAEQREERGRGAIDAAARSVGNYGDRFVRGAERIVTGDVSPGEFAQAGERVVRNVTSPVGGDYLAAGGENIMRFITGQENNPNALNEQRERRRLMNEVAQDPLGQAAAEGLGFGGLFKAITGVAPSLAVTAPSRASQTLRPKITNAIRTGTEGALTTAIGENMKGTDAPQTAASAGLAAILGPILSGITRGGTQGVQGALTEDPAEQGMRSLYQRVEGSSDELAARADTARQQRRLVGPEPRAIDQLNTREIGNVRMAAQTRPGAADALDELEVEAADVLPTQLRESIEMRNSQRPETVETLENNANTRLTADLREPPRKGATPVADRPVTNQAEFAQWLDDNADLVASLPRPLRAQLANAADNNALTVDMVEQLRHGISSRGGPGPAYRFFEAAGEIKDLAFKGSTAYKQAFDRYKKAFNFIDGFKRGRGSIGRDSAEIQQFMGRETDPDIVRGVKEGVRAELGSQAGGRSRDAIRVADEMGFNRDLQDIMRATIGDAEATRLMNIGRTMRRRTDNARDISPRSELPPSLREASGDFAEGLATVGGRGSAISQARTFERTLAAFRGIGLPDVAAEQMARAVFREGGAEEVFRRLSEIGANEEALGLLAQEISSIISKPAAAEVGDSLTSTRQDVDEQVRSARVREAQR